MSGRAASRIFVAALFFLVLSVIVFLIQFIRRGQEIQSRAVLAIQVGSFVLGICLLVTAFVMAALTGSIETLTSNLFVAGPLKFTRGVVDDTYGACVVKGESRSCTQYCCSSTVDSNIKWRDCNSKCTSNDSQKFTVTERDNTTGAFLDCSMDMTRDSYCDVSFLTDTNAPCNYDEHRGPVTCTCCIGFDDDEVSWWDCNNTCNSASGTKGLGMPKSLCLERKTKTSSYMCLEDMSDSLDVSESNTQSF